MNANPIDKDLDLARVWIDQLAANELGELERIQLMRWLEDSRERWRDLGLAFLEAQIWSSSFADWEQSGMRLPMERSAVDTRAKASSLKTWGWGVVLAASLLVTFFGGIRWAEFKSVDRLSEGQLVQGNQLPSQELENNLAQTAADKRGPETQDGSAAKATSTFSSQAFEISAYSKNAMGAIEKIKVPVTASKSFARLSGESEKIIRSLEDRGFAVKTEQRYLPATLPDGRQVMVPFEQLLTSYIGKTVY